MAIHTILVVEDEREIAELIAFNLEQQGFNVVTALDGIAGLDEARRTIPDLILLDLMLPKLQGTELCKMLKTNEKTAAIPVIMLTAKGEEIDKVVGLEVGADDYVVKPFSVRELMLRVKAVLKRSKSQGEPSPVITAGAVCIDAVRHSVTSHGVEVSLTSVEFKLLLTLAQRLGRVQSREQLLRDVWGYNYVEDTRTVDTHITRLRTKLGRGGDLIKTIRGFGYKMEVL